MSEYRIYELNLINILASSGYNMGRKSMNVKCILDGEKIYECQDGH